jgi:hypothetical protein
MGVRLWEVVAPTLSVIPPTSGCLPPQELAALGSATANIMRKTHDLVSKREFRARESLLILPIYRRGIRSRPAMDWDFRSFRSGPDVLWFFPAGLTCLRALDRIRFIDGVDNEFVHQLLALWRGSGCCFCYGGLNV